MAIKPFELSHSKAPPLGFYFMVTILIGGFVPNPIDIRFQKVSGMTSTIETTEIREGGENIFCHKVPNRITYPPLVLERGMVVSLSPLTIELNAVMSTMMFQPGNILVSLLNAEDHPTAAWFFYDTYPVKWSVSDLDANSNSVMIETMEITYSKLVNVRI